MSVYSTLVFNSALQMKLKKTADSYRMNLHYVVDASSRAKIQLKG